MDTIRKLIRLLLNTIYFKRDSMFILRGPLRGLRIPKDIGLWHLSMLVGRYEINFVSCFISNVKSGAVVLDIGSNFGYFSLCAVARNASCVIGFEPVPQLQKAFKNTMTINRCSDRARMVPFAVSEESSDCDLLLSNSSSTGILRSSLSAKNKSDQAAISVKTISVDAWVKNNQNLKPDLIKIDVEGAEAAVLRGAAQLMANEDPPKILMEVHGLEAASEVWDEAERLQIEVSLIKSDRTEILSCREAWLDLFAESRWRICHVLLTKTVE